MDGDEKIYCLLCCNAVIRNFHEEIDLLEQLYKLLNCPGMLSLQMNEGIRNSEFCGPCSRALIDSMKIFEQMKKLAKSLEEIREQMKMCIIAAYQDDTNLKEGQTNEIRPRCLVRKTLALHLLASGEEKEVGHDSEEDPEVKIENSEDEIDSYEGSNFSDESGEDGTEESENYDCLDKQHQPLEAILDAYEGNEFIDESEDRDLDVCKNPEKVEPPDTAAINGVSEPLIEKDPLEVTPESVDVQLPSTQVPGNFGCPLGDIISAVPVPPVTSVPPVTLVHPAGPLRPIAPRPNVEVPLTFLVYTIATPTTDGLPQGGSFPTSPDPNPPQKRALKNSSRKSGGTRMTRKEYLETFANCPHCNLGFKLSAAGEASMEGLDQSSHLKPLTDSEGNEYITAPMELLRNHRRRHVHSCSKKHQIKKDIFRCEKCDHRIFSCKQALQFHISRIHEKQYRHICAICGTGRMTLGELNLHVQEVHCEKSIECEVCSKSFKSTRYLQSHKKSHDESRPRPFICEVCGKGFLDAKQLKEHGIVHTDKSQRMLVKKLPCDQCKKSFDKHYRLRNHILRSHQKKIENCCEICGKGFLKVNDVRMHIAQVHPERMVECDTCQKRFKTKYQLKTHVQRTHESDKQPRVPCDKCDKTFRNNSTLENHIEGVHEKMFQHFCSICGKGFLKASALKVHVSEVHSEKTVECNICQKAFKSEYQMSSHKKKVHEKLRPFICDVCGKGFLHKCLLQNHLAIHGDKKTP